jgi:hypothetical protein
VGFLAHLGHQELGPFVADLRPEEKPIIRHPDIAIPDLRGAALHLALARRTLDSLGHWTALL